MDYFEEAEFGFRKSGGICDHELDTWLFWLILVLGEYNTNLVAVNITLKKMK
jgi:hypothetical protein